METAKRRQECSCINDNMTFPTVHGGTSGGRCDVQKQKFSIENERRARSTDPSNFTPSKLVKPKNGNDPLSNPFSAIKETSIEPSTRIYTFSKSKPKRCIYFRLITVFILACILAFVTYKLLQCQLPQEEIVVIESIDDVLDLKPYCNTLSVQSLPGDDYDPDIEIPAQPKQSVKHLEVSGYISEEWVQFLLGNFNQIEELTLDINQLCLGSRNPDRDSLPSLALNHVKVLTIHHSDTCPLTDWVFRWELPRLEKIVLDNVKLIPVTFQPLEHFLETHKEQLKSLSIARSSLCGGCRFSKQIRKAVRITVADGEDEDSSEDK